MFSDSSLKKGSVVTFGAALAAFRFDDAREEWAVLFAPESGVFMLHPSALTELGLEPDDHAAEDDRP